MSVRQPFPVSTASGGGAPTDATYITQTANGSLSAEQAIGALGTGILFGTTTTGIITSLGPTAIVQGDILYGSAANTLLALAKDANATRYLSNAGGSNNPSWTQIVLTNGVSGILPTANGGTGIAYFTAAGPTTARVYTFADAAMTIVGTTDTQTLTNKRVTKRAPTVTQSATPTINTDVTDVAHITGLAQAITSMTTNLSGTPVEGDTLRIDITDNGTARAITWGASFEASGTVALPTTTVLSVRLDVGFFWNTVTSKWRCVASS